MHSNNSWARGFMALFAIVLAMGLGLAACPAEAAPFLYVANSVDNTVSVIDTATNTVVGSPIPVGIFPRAVAITPNGTQAYVVNGELQHGFGDRHGYQYGGRITDPGGVLPHLGRSQPEWDTGLRHECLQHCFGDQNGQPSGGGDDSGGEYPRRGSHHPGRDTGLCRE